MGIDWKTNSGIREKGIYEEKTWRKGTPGFFAVLNYIFNKVYKDNYFSIVF